MMKTVAALESDTSAIVASVKAQIATIRERAADEGRAETDSERAEIDRLLREATSAKSTLERRRSEESVMMTLQRLEGSGAVGAPALSVGGGGAFTAGQLVVRAWEPWVRATLGSRPRHWQTPVIEVPHGSLRAATLTEDPASGGKLVIPDYRPGVIDTLFRRRVVADLIASGTTDSNLITYMVETAYVIAADTVAEAGLKPESTLTFDALSDPVRKIAHWLPVTEEMLEDAAYIRSYIDGRLRLGIELVEDDQLLNGTTTAPDIVGIRNRAGLAPPVAKGADTVPDAIAKQISAIANTAMVPPDGIVMNPADWLGLQLLKNDAGDYLSEGGPFASPQAPTLWGLPVAVNRTGLVGGPIQREDGTHGTIQ